MDEITIKEQEKYELENRVRSGANWFYWIAVLSLINSILLLYDSGRFFIIGLAITQIIDIIIGSWIAFAFDIVVAGILILFGTVARKRNKWAKWAFIVGMTLYGLDGLLYLYFTDYFSFGFHLFALYGIYGGFNASMKIGDHEESLQGSPQAV